MSVSLGEVIAGVGAVASLIIWVIHAIIKPLRDSLDRVNATLEKLDQTISEERQRRQAVELEVRELETVVTNHEHRLDILERK